MRIGLTSEQILIWHEEKDCRVIREARKGYDVDEMNEKQSSF